MKMNCPAICFEPHTHVYIIYFCANPVAAIKFVQSCGCVFVVDCVWRAKVVQIYKKNLKTAKLDTIILQLEKLSLGKCYDKNSEFCAIACLLNFGEHVRL